ncbi:MAG: SDR family oxidoreductase [Bacteroidia bacterium]
MKTYLITGVTGFLGSKLAMSLLNSNCKVVGIGRSEKHPDILECSEHKHFQYIRGEISDSILAKLNNIEISGIFHLASQLPNKPYLNYEDYYRGNVSSTLHLIKYFKDKKIDFFTYTSTGSVFGKNKNDTIDESSVPEPTNYYGLTKYIAEKALEIESVNFQTNVIVIRFQSIFGKGDRYGIVSSLYKQFKRNEDVELYSKGNVFRNLISVEDAIEILESIVQRHKDLSKFELFHAGGKNSIKTLDIALLIKKNLQSNSNIVLSDKKSIYDWDVFVNISKAQKKLNFQPHSIEEGINKYLNQLKIEV